MADVKISGLPAGTVAGASLMPAVTSGTTHQATVQAATTAGLKALNINVGNSVISLNTPVQAGVNFQVYGTMTGSTAANCIIASAIVQSDVTGNARMFMAYPQTAAQNFTVTQLTNFYSGLAAKGAGSTITTHIGFLAESTMNQATNNYGFYGNLASAAGSWNVYCGGSAANYMAGNLRIGTTTQVIGGISVFDVVGGRSTFTDNAAPYSIGLKYNAAGVLVYAGATAAGDFQVSTAAGGSLFTVSQTAGSVGNVTLSGNSMRILASSTPTSAATAGNAGEIRWDSGYIYVCTTTGAAGAAIWKRAALTQV